MEGGAAKKSDGRVPLVVRWLLYCTPARTTRRLSLLCSVFVGVLTVEAETQYCVLATSARFDRAPGRGFLRIHGTPKAHLDMYLLRNNRRDINEV